MATRYLLKPISPCLLISAVLAIFYVIILIFFSRLELYDRYFLESGGIVTRYQIARIIFALFFGWMVYSVGAWSLALSARSHARLPGWQWHPLCFITGAGVSHVVLFITGLMGLHTKSFLVPLTLVIMAYSISLFEANLRALTRQAMGRMRLSMVLLVAALAIVLGDFILVKGIYPGGGHDYYNHYFRFYTKVVETGSTRPNEIWYHFYYSKGAGLFFAAMSLTDPLAPQLVASGFVLCGAAIIFAWLREASMNVAIAMTGAILYIAFLIYTPGSRIQNELITWGDLEKLHELTAVLILATAWCSYVLLRRPDVWAPWFLGLLAATLASILVTLQLAAIILPIIGAFSCFCIWRRYLFGFKLFFVAGCVGVSAVITVLIVNYAFTGLLSDQILPRAWAFSDVNKLDRWGALFELLVQFKDMNFRVSHVHPIGWSDAVDVLKYMRLDVWWPLYLAIIPATACVALTQAGRKELRARSDAALLVVVGAVAMAVAILGIAHRDQSISFYRLTTLTYGITLIPVLWLWVVLAHVCRILHIPMAFRASVVVGICLATTAMYVAPSMPIRDARNILRLTANSINLFNGQMSLKQAYQNRDSAIYPGIVVPWKALPPGQRFWSFHLHTYCMLPRCNLQTFFSSILSPSWPTILFGPTQDSIATLKREGLNYFFIAPRLVLVDPLLSTEIFAPGSIGRYMGVVWSDGENHLLTWRDDPSALPLDERFLEAYAGAVRRDHKYSFDTASPEWRSIAAYISANKGHLRPFRLSWCKTCDGLPDVGEASK